MKCHACGEPIASSRIHTAERFVASDCQPIIRLLTLAACDACGLVQKEISREWNEACDTIYSNYRIYHQAAGKEQKVRGVSENTFAPRSELLADFLAMTAKLGESGRVLDIGCGNGAFLRAFHNVFPVWKISGAELNPTFEQDIRGIAPGASFLSSDLGSLNERFDLVTLIHCLEHIPAPVRYLAEARRLLEPDSILLIQVPDAEKNPFDLVIADHASHYSKAALAAVVTDAGLAVLACGNLVLGKEISLLAKVPTAKAAGMQRQSVSSAFLEPSLAWIKAIADQARQLGKRQPFGVFGSSIAASWIASQSDIPVSFFVDDDKDRCGRTHMGLPILAPGDVPANGHVLLALEPGLARGLERRLASYGYCVVLPSDIP